MVETIPVGKEVSSKIPAGRCGRMLAKAVLEDKIRRKESELNALRVLLKCVPWDSLVKEDEALLWGYFVRREQ